MGARLKSDLLVHLEAVSVADKMDNGSASRSHK